MSLRLEGLAKKLEAMEIRERKRRKFNTEVLLCVDKWLRAGKLTRWTGFTHLGLLGNKNPPPGWSKPEVLLDIAVFRSRPDLRPIFGAELEWSMRRKRKESANSTKFLKKLELKKTLREKQAMRDRAYDLSRLLTVGPSKMAFLAREDKDAKSVLKYLVSLARELSENMNVRVQRNLLIGVLSKADDTDLTFITKIL